MTKAAQVLDVFDVGHSPSVGRCVGWDERPPGQMTQV